jgi:hypothetical protein
VNFEQEGSVLERFGWIEEGSHYRGIHEAVARVQVARDGPGTTPHGITRRLGAKLAAVPIHAPVALRLRSVEIAGVEVAVCLAKALEQNPCIDGGVSAAGETGVCAPSGAEAGDG